MKNGCDIRRCTQQSNGDNIKSLKNQVAAVSDNYLHPRRPYCYSENFNDINTYEYLRGTINLSSILGMSKRPILKEAEDIQKVRNKVVHQGYEVTDKEFGHSKNIAYLILTEVVEPVLNNLELVISSNESGFCIKKS